MFEVKTYIKQDQPFDEIAVANLNFCQILVPCTKTLTAKYIGSVEVVVPVRIYSPAGIVVANEEKMATLYGLKFKTFVSDESPFKIPTRLAPAIPLGFECRSESSLPEALLKHATMICKVPDTDCPYYTIFENIKPRFVRTYNAMSSLSSIEIVRKMLAEEKRFVVENHSNLCNVPFYREQFGL